MLKIIILLFFLLPMTSKGESCVELLDKIVLSRSNNIPFTFLYSDFEVALSSKYYERGNNYEEVTRKLARVKQFFTDGRWLFDQSSGRVFPNTKHPDYRYDRVNFPKPSRFLPPIEPPLSGSLIGYDIRTAVRAMIKFNCIKNGNSLYLKMPFQILLYDPFYEMATVRFANGSKQYIHLLKLSD